MDRHIHLVNGVEAPFSDAELAQYEIDKQTFAEENAKYLAKVEARKNALEKLSALGLSEEEIQALIKP